MSFLTQKLLEESTLDEKEIKIMVSALLLELYEHDEDKTKRGLCSLVAGFEVIKKQGILKKLKN